MTSSAADRFGGAAGGGGEEHLLLHHPQMYYHVPQHSRREKLRFPPEETPAASTSLLLLHDPGAGPQPLYASQNSLTAFLPSSSSPSTSSSPSYYSLHSPVGLGYGVTQFDGGHVALPILPPPQHGSHHQIPSQGFSLSLSSSSPLPPPPAGRQPLPSRPAPLGPFTGYAAVLNRSRFLDPARKLLEEVCHAAHQAAGGGKELLLPADPPRESLMDHGPDELTDHAAMDEDCSISGPEQQWKKTTLISMLDEVCRRYKQYYQQAQAVITSFESVAGLSSAAPFASAALKAMSKHFQCLKNIISDQLRQTNKGLSGKASAAAAGTEDVSGFGLLNSNGYLQRTMTSNNDAFAQPHIWRPQRGLPERAVSVLRAWLFEHFLHPYPTDVDKQNLAKQTGLTRNQVSNWFINARVRLWKPMVEEIHTLEMRQKSKASSASELSNRDGTAAGEHFSSQQLQMTAVAGKGGIQEELSSVPAGCQIQEPQMSFAYADVPNRGGGAPAGVGSSSGNVVSLTLGLHQNNSGSGGAAASAGVCFSEQLPLNVARRFGLEECNDSYLVGAFGGQERPFGKDVGGRLLHDFVG